MKIANIDREFLHIFWKTWGNSVKFSGKMCFKITLKVAKNQGSTLSIEDIFFKKPQGVSIWPTWYTCIFYWMAYNKIQVFCTINAMFPNS